MTGNCHVRCEAGESQEIISNGYLSLSLIQRALLSIYTKHNPDAKVVCCAPTGRAARMEQCTGFPPSTIHKALSLTVGDNESRSEPETLDADFILVDEVSISAIRS